ncbi:glutathione transferase GstA [Acinetobacter seifertii]|uniref:glutathione transferase GstA n=1 Tax=Acinetobacter seifertii TaxID=1530123 RepID=UPI000C1F66AD|nr:glutathione transferase GstA [Acinetobacter seifertii]PJF03319.1 glutathione transferase GstA [Acinetobacter seifertii]PJG69199.1 glutathione transferase GstA [Acinetobacter seifertii]
MKLYYSPGACSLSPHIIIKELNLDVDLIQVDLSTHTTESGKNYFEINSRGQVPLLELDNGETITEGPIITQFLAEKSDNKSIYPANGTLERYRVHEWQNYITSELHKSFAPLFNPDFDEGSKKLHSKILLKKYDWINEKLKTLKFLANDNFTIADSYFFTVTNWANFVNLDLSHLEHLQNYLKRIADRPSVQKALKAEGLVPST